MRLRRACEPGDPLLAAAETAEALFAAGRYEQARAAFTACIADHQAALPDHLNDILFNARIGGLLNHLGLTLNRLRRFPEAAEIMEGAVAVYDGLVRLDDAARWRPYMAGSLQTLAQALLLGGQPNRALTISREAVELRRQSPVDLDQAKALRMFALVRAGAGAELEEALSALDDAMSVHMTLLTRQGESALDELYTTELAQASVLERMGKTAQGARVAQLARSRHLDGISQAMRRM